MKAKSFGFLTFVLMAVCQIRGYAASISPPTCGLTIITHGFQPPGGDGALPGWVSEMANAINARTGADLPIYRFRFDKDSFHGLTDFYKANDKIVPAGGDVDLALKGGAIILLDWVGVSNETLNYPTQEVADKFYAYLFERPHHGRNLASIPIHLIGHSRGSSLNSRLAQRLAEKGVVIDQITTLDPHPVTWGGGRDLVPETFKNVVFADNYYEAIDFPEGRAIAGAANLNLSGSYDVLELLNLIPGSLHARVHDYYHGTISLVSGVNPGNIEVNENWYLRTLPKQNIGFNLSRYTNSAIARPLVGLSAYIQGAEGMGSRVDVPAAGQQWPNVFFDQRAIIADRVTVGQKHSIPYYFGDRDSQQSITFFLHTSTMPYSSGQRQIGSTVLQNSRSKGTIGAAVHEWTPGTADVGTWFIGAMTTDNGNTRYDYFFKPITVEAAQLVRPIVLSVTPRTLNGLPTPQTQRITLTGSDFLQTSTLVFNDGVMTYPPKTPVFLNSTELKYDIAVGTAAANWTVKVVNGEVESDPFPFSVIATPDIIAPSAPVGLAAAVSTWAQGFRVLLDWTNPTDASGIVKAWVRIGTPPASPTDGVAYPLPANKPLLVTLPITDSTRSVHVWLEDGAGNRDHANRATVTPGVDSTAPVVSITSPNTNPLTTTQSSIALSGTFSDNLSGVASITWRLSGGGSGNATILGSAAAGTWNTPAISLQPGLNTVSVTATDAAGNEGVSTVQVSYVNATNSSAVTVNLSPPEAVTAGAQWRINAGSWRNSGFTEVNVPSGPRFVDYKPINGWRTPDGQIVRILGGENLTVSAAYSQLPQIVPPSAPANPFPAYGAVNVSRVQPRFSWTGGTPGGDLQYALCIDPANPSNPDPPIYAAFGSLVDNSFQYATALAAASTFNWRVKALANGIVVDGPLWRFATEYSYADLLPVDFQVDGNIAPGSNVVLSVTITNQGSFLAPAGRVYFYLSRQPGAKARWLNQTNFVTVSPLAPGEAIAITNVVGLKDLGPGQSFIDVWVDTTAAGGSSTEGNSDNNIASLPVHYVDGIDPEITHLGLSADRAITGTSTSVSFTARDDVAISTMDFYWSIDGGLTWTTILEGFVPFAPEGGTGIGWAVPANLPATNNLMLRAVARDVSGNRTERTAGPYSVLDGVTKPTVTLLSPNGGEVWGAGSSQQIRWSVSSPNGIQGMNLYVYYGGSARFIADITANSTGVYQWTVPSDLSSVDAKVRIFVGDTRSREAVDYSDNYFAIQDNSIIPAPWTTPMAQTLVNPGDPSGKRHYGPRVAVGPNGTMHMVYLYTSDNGSSPVINYKNKVGTTWSPAMLVASANAQDLGITVDQQGMPHVVWATTGGNANATDIYYSVFNGSAWSSPLSISDNIPGALGQPTPSQSPRIDITVSNVVQIIWTELNVAGSGNNLFHRSKNPAGVWSSVYQVTTSGGAEAAIKADAQNTLHVVYRTGSSMKHLQFDGTTWSSPITAFTMPLGSMDLAIDTADRLHMAFHSYDGTAYPQDRILYSTFNGLAWSDPELVSNTDDHFVGDHPSIVTDSLNRPHVIWEDTASPVESLWYKRKNGAVWSPAAKLSQSSKRVIISSSDAAMLASSNAMHIVWTSPTVGYDGSHEVFFTSAAVGSTDDTYPPAVSVSTPLGNEVLPVGSSVAIQWTATDDTGATAIHLHYSTNSGILWNLIATNQGNTGSFAWSVPHLNTNVAQIRVTAVDASGNVGYGYSGFFATADLAAPAIALTSPAAGSLLTSGNLTSVAWIAADNIGVVRVGLYYSLNFGGTWSEIATNLTDTGTYSWTVPSLVPGILLLRATATDAAGYTTTSSVQSNSIVRENTPPLTPNGLFPLSGAFNESLTPALHGSTFFDPDGDDHTGTQWQLFNSTGTTVVWDSNDDTTNRTVRSVPSGLLQYSTSYLWQVRYKDGRGMWSAFSPQMSFTTVASSPPTFASQPTNMTVVQGQTAFFFSGAGGTAPLGYQWFFNVTNALAGATNATLTFSNVQPAVAGNYTVVVTNVAGSVTSVVATLSVLVPPSITVQPVSQTVSVGQSASFSVTATGTAPLSYQWRKDGLELASQTAITLALTNVTRAQSGLYSVVVSNTVGNMMSSNALLRVLVPQRFDTNRMSRLPNGRFRLVFGDFDSGPLNATNLVNFEVHATTNFVNWVTLTNGFTLTNGQVQVEDTGSANLPRRFYRVIER